MLSGAAVSSAALAQQDLSNRSRIQLGGSGTGGLHLTSATARLTNTVITQNRTTTGGGLYVIGTTLQAQHITVVSNTTASGESAGVCH